MKDGSIARYEGQKPQGIYVAFGSSQKYINLRLAPTATVVVFIPICLLPTSSESPTIQIQLLVCGTRKMIRVLCQDMPLVFLLMLGFKVRTVYAWIPLC